MKCRFRAQVWYVKKSPGALYIIEMEDLLFIILKVGVGIALLLAALLLACRDSEERHSYAVIVLLMLGGMAMVSLL